MLAWKFDASAGLHLAGRPIFCEGRLIMHDILTLIWACETSKGRVEIHAHSRVVRIFYNAKGSGFRVYWDAQLIPAGMPGRLVAIQVSIDGERQFILTPLSQDEYHAVWAWWCDVVFSRIRWMREKLENFPFDEGDERDIEEALSHVLERAPFPKF